MKTKNHVRIMRMRTLAIIAFFAFIGISVHGQDIWKFIQEYDTKSENTVRISGERSISKFPIKKRSFNKAIPSYFNEAKEEILKLEDWMLDEKNFDVPKNTLFISSYEEEPNLKLEGWMLDDINFNVKPLKEENPEYGDRNYAHQNAINKKFRLEK